MSKIVKTLVVAAVAVAIVVFAPQLAAFLGPLVGAAAGTAAAVALTSAIVGIGISLGLTAVMGLFRKTPSMTQSMVDRLNTSVVPTAPRKIVFGTTCAGADVRFFEAEIDLPGTKKDGYTQVIAAASHKISAFKSWYIENDLTWTSGGGIQGKYARGIVGFSSVAEGKAGNAIELGSKKYWKGSTNTFTGCAYYAPTYKLDPEVFDSGVPTRLTMIVDGCPVYDPRLDSTRGGSGPHRYGDQTTYAFKNGSVDIGRNPALSLLTYLIGWKVGGKLMWGMGIPATRIDFANFILYANLCEEGVTTQAGGTIQRYTADGIFSTTDTHETVISQLTAAMGSCKLSDRGGVYCLVGGYDDTAAPKVAFTADDLVAAAGGGSPYSWSPAPASRECFNIVRGRYADPSNLYQLSDWGDPIETDALADGVPRTMTLDLGCVSRPDTCQRIAKQFLLREAKTPGQFSATFGARAFAVQVGDLITLSLPSEGWNNKLFRVMEQAESHDLFFQMSLREDSPEVYAWDREEKPLPASIRPAPYDPSTTITPAGLALTSDSYAGANNYNVSEVHVSWTPELSGRVAGIQIQSRPSGASAWTEQAALYDPGAGTFTFSSNAPGITVEVRARYRMTNAIYSPWVSANIATAAVVTVTDWENVTDNSGNRPEPNATVGAPDGSYVGTPGSGGVLAQNLVSQANTATTNIATILSPTGPIKQSITDVDTKANGIRTDLSAAQLSLQSATSQIALVQNQLTIRPNLQRNGNFNNGLTGLDGYTPARTAIVVDDPLWGTYLSHNQNAATGIAMPYVNTTPNSAYTVSFDSAIFATAGTSRVDVICYSAANAGGTATFDLYSSSVRSANTDFNDSGPRQSFTFTAPSTCRSIRVRLITENVAGAQTIGFRRIKVERSTSASLWSDDTSVNVVNANVSTESQTRLDADSALGVRIDTVTASVKTTNDKIDANYTIITGTIATDKAAQATLNTRLSAQVAGGQNLCENGGFERKLDGIGGNLTGWSTSEGVWGVIASALVNGTGVLAWPRFAVQAGEWYTIAADTLLLADAGSVYVDIIFQNAQGNDILDGPQKPYAAGHDFSNDGSGREKVAVEVQAPANAVTGLPRFVWDSVSGVRALGVREVMVERGRLPWSPYIASAKSVRKSNAEITSNQETIANTNLSLANYKLDVAAMFSGATGTGLSGRIEDNRVAAATATSAVAQSVNTVKAFAQARPNLAADVVKWTNYNGSVYGQGGWGPQIGCAPPVTGEVTYGTSPYISVFSNAAYTYSFDAAVFASAGSYVWGDIVWLDALGNIISYSARTTISAQADFSDDRPRDTLSITATAPSNATIAYLRFCGNKGGNGPITTYFGLRRPKFEQGGNASAYTTEGMVSSVNATVTQQAGVLADLNGRTQAYLSLAVDVGGTGTAGLFLNAKKGDGSTTSAIDLYAQKINIWNPAAGAAGNAGAYVQAIRFENGNAVFGGKLTARAIDAQQISIGGVDVSNIASTGYSSDGSGLWQGSVTCSGLNEQKQTPFAMTVSNIQAKGRFLLLDTSTLITSNAGEQVQNNYNNTGKPLYIHIMADWTTDYLCSDNEGNIYNARDGRSQRIRATTPFNAYWRCFLRRGNTDTGVTNQGDFYERYVSATPTISLVSGSITWVAT